ncbi:hypothetical protein PIB30_057685 [Stylosanthes scabra]|uniref:Uncharacterized protein n=1 Tax=Stylosanthes scabra TaxID=79078 RepID=A0ABU6TJJ3_9FABA|nr:hypothetical protein [Stylosanthes scabra]
MSNKPHWTIPLIPTEITKDYDSTTPSVGYYSRDSNLDSNPILPMLFFSKKKNPKEQPETKTSPKTPPHQHKPPPDQNPETHHEQVPHPHPPHPHHPPYQPNPYDDYNDPPNYYERRRPFGSNLPPITPFIEPFLRKPNQDDPESKDTDDDQESKKNTDPKSRKKRLIQSQRRQIQNQTRVLQSQRRILHLMMIKKKKTHWIILLI